MSNPIDYEDRTELVVYLCHCVEHGPEHRLFDEEDMQAAGGIYGVERELERDSYWYVRLGTIQAQHGGSGWSFTDEALATLHEPSLDTWHLGRRNPSFQRGPLERQIFVSLVQELSAFLTNWNHEEGGTTDAYAIKQIRISPNRLSSISSALSSIRRAYEVVEMTVLKYWYDPSWKATCRSTDLILAEFDVTIPLQLRLCSAEKVIAMDVLSISAC